MNLRFPNKLIVSIETLMIKEQKVKWRKTVLRYLEVMIYGNQILSHMFDLNEFSTDEATIFDPD